MKDKRIRSSGICSMNAMLVLNIKTNQCGISKLRGRKKAEN